MGVLMGAEHRSDSWIELRIAEAVIAVVDRPLAAPIPGVNVGAAFEEHCDGVSDFFFDGVKQCG